MCVWRIEESFFGTETLPFMAEGLVTINGSMQSDGGGGGSHYQDAPDACIGPSDIEIHEREGGSHELATQGSSSGVGGGACARSSREAAPAEDGAENGTAKDEAAEHGGGVAGGMTGFTTSATGHTTSVTGVTASATGFTSSATGFTTGATGGAAIEASSPAGIGFSYIANGIDASKNGSLASVSAGNGGSAAVKTRRERERHEETVGAEGEGGGWVGGEGTKEESNIESKVTDGDGSPSMPPPLLMAPPTVTPPPLPPSIADMGPSQKSLSRSHSGVSVVSANRCH